MNGRRENLAGAIEAIHSVSGDRGWCEAVGAAQRANVSFSGMARQPPRDRPGLKAAIVRRKAITSVSQSACYASTIVRQRHDPVSSNVRRNTVLLRVRRFIQAVHYCASSISNRPTAAARDRQHVCLSGHVGQGQAAPHRPSKARAVAVMVTPRSDRMRPGSITSMNIT